jgi:hypothetical protein
MRVRVSERVEGGKGDRKVKGGRLDGRVRVITVRREG